MELGVVIVALFTKLKKVLSCLRNLIAFDRYSNDTLVSD